MARCLFVGMDVFAAGIGAVAPIRSLNSESLLKFEVPQQVALDQQLEFKQTPIAGVPFRAKQPEKAYG